MYESILLPVPTNNQDTVVRKSIELANDLDGLLHILYIIEIPAIYTRAAGPAVLDLDNEIERQYHLARDLVTKIVQMANEEEVSIYTAIRIGSPIGTALDYATDHDIDLIVCGAPERRSFKEFIIGTTSERLSKKSEIPIVVIGAEVTEPRRSGY